MQYSTIQYNTRISIKLHYITIPYNTIQYNTTRHNTPQYNTRQDKTIQYNTIQYKTIQYNTIHLAVSITRMRPPRPAAPPSARPHQTREGRQSLPGSHRQELPIRLFPKIMKTLSSLLHPRGRDRTLACAGPTFSLSDKYRAQYIAICAIT